MDIFAATAAGRHALADVVATLDDAQLATPSLCAGWDVRTVVAHLVFAADPSPGPFVAAVVRSFGNLHKANTLAARAQAELPRTDLVTLLHQRAGSRSTPPLVGPRGPMTDVLVHTGDAVLPLGLPFAPDPEAVAVALDFLVDGRPIGFVPKGRLAGLRLVATDLGREWGTGSSVLSGRGADLMMAACGRSSVLPSLAGDGVAVLRSRL